MGSCAGAQAAEQALEFMKAGPAPSIPVDHAWDISKVYEEEGAWYVEGYCTTYVPDQINDEVTPEAAIKAAKRMVGAPLLENHDPNRAVGKVVVAQPDEVGLFVKCLVSKAEPNIWVKVQEGVLSKFSIRMWEPEGFNRRREAGVRKIRLMHVPEISLTSLPMHLEAAAELAYVEKNRNRAGSDLEVSAMKGNLGEVLETFQSASARLMEDYNAGRLTELTEGVKTDQAQEGTPQDAGDESQQDAGKDGVKEAGKAGQENEDTSQDGTTDEKVKQDDAEAAVGGDRDGDTKQDQPEKEYGYGKQCPSYKKGDCPVEKAAEAKKAEVPEKEYPEPGKVPTEAKSCPKAKTYTCPWLAKAGKSAEMVKLEQLEALVVRALENQSELAKALVAKIEQDEKSRGEAVSEAKQTAEEAMKTVTELQSELTEKLKSLEAMESDRQGLEDESPGGVRREKGTFVSCFPF